VSAGRTALQLARIPALLMLLWSAAWPAEVKTRAIARISQEDYWLGWALIALLNLAFVIVMLVGRRRWHLWVVLAVEAAVAGVVAIVPPFYWALWFGIGGGVGESWVTAMGGGFAQALAMAWLGVVGLQAFHQLRAAPEALSRPGGRDAAPSTQSGR
jgi:hypothetical protein